VLAWFVLVETWRLVAGTAVMVVVMVMARSVITWAVVLVMMARSVTRSVMMMMMVRTVPVATMPVPARAVSLFHSAICVVVHAAVSVIDVVVATELRRFVGHIVRHLTTADAGHARREETDERKSLTHCRSHRTASRCVNSLECQGPRTLMQLYKRAAHFAATFAESCPHRLASLDESEGRAAQSMSSPFASS
jgi:hypothetical protein